MQSVEKVKCVGDGVHDVPQRGAAALSFRTSDRVTGVGIRSSGAA